MNEVTATTSTLNGEVEYPLTYREFESVDEILETVDGGEETLVAIVNSNQRQNALQTGKEEVRDAAKEHGPDSPEVEEAIASHQEHAAGYVIGRPRGRSTGLTKTKAREIGERMRDQLGEDGLAEMAEELGIEL